MALLLPALASRGHRTLVFSQSVKMLDLVQLCVLKPNSLRCVRIVGQTDPMERARKVDKFNQHRERFQCMLLTTSVGGVGLNLTSADRVVIVDPAWNPAIDAQAVDRTYRIGQEREVRVYRLITSGLIEDKMFRLQVFKMGLEKTVLEASQHHRYFSSNEIKNLFDWTDPKEGVTCKLLLEEHGAANDAALHEAAEEDGATADGWLGDWLAAGASDFGVFVRGKAAPVDDVEHTIETEVLDAQEKLHAAEKKTQSVIDAQEAADARCKAIAEERAEAGATISSSAAARSVAKELVRQRRRAVAKGGCRCGVAYPEERACAK
jgi:superfamily II DNA/RNA helicase